MKKLFAVSILALTTLLPGCRTAAAPTPALAPGYVNQADQTMGQTLAAARAFYVHINGDVKAGKYKVSEGAEKDALTSLFIALSTADPVYVQFHTGAATQAQAQAVVDKVTAAQTSLQALVK